MNDYEDDEFNRIEMEARVRMMAVRYAMEQAEWREFVQNNPPIAIPFITAEDWEKIKEQGDEKRY